MRLIINVNITYIVVFCFYSNIYKLEPGSFLKISNPEIIGDSKSYWSAIDAALEIKPFDEKLIIP